MKYVRNMHTFKYRRKPIRHMRAAAFSFLFPCPFVFCGQMQQTTFDKYVKL